MAWDPEDKFINRENPVFYFLLFYIRHKSTFNEKRDLYGYNSVEFNVYKVDVIYKVT